MCHEERNVLIASDNAERPLCLATRSNVFRFGDRSISVRDGFIFLSEVRGRAGPHAGYLERVDIYLRFFSLALAIESLQII